MALSPCDPEFQPEVMVAQTKMRYVGREEIEESCRRRSTGSRQRGPAGEPTSRIQGFFRGFPKVEVPKNGIVVFLDLCYGPFLLGN